MAADGGRWGDVVASRKKSCGCPPLPLAISMLGLNSPRPGNSLPVVLSKSPARSPARSCGSCLKVAPSSSCSPATVPVLHETPPSAERHLTLYGICSGSPVKSMPQVPTPAPDLRPRPFGRSGETRCRLAVPQLAAQALPPTGRLRQRQPQTRPPPPQLEATPRSVSDLAERDGVAAPLGRRSDKIVPGRPIPSRGGETPAKSPDAAMRPPAAGPLGKDSNTATAEVACRVRGEDEGSGRWRGSDATARQAHPWGGCLERHATLGTWRRPAESSHPRQTRLGGGGLGRVRAAVRR